MHDIYKSKRDVRKSLTHIQCLSGNQIKIIAAICMFIDHFSKTVWKAIVNVIIVPMCGSGQLSWKVFEGPVRIGNMVIQNGPLVLADQVFDFIGAIAFPLFCCMFVEGYQHTKSKKRYVCRLALFAVISELPFDITFFRTEANLRNTYPFYWGYQNVFVTFLVAMCALLAIDQLQKLRCKPLSVLLQGIFIGGITLLAQYVIRGDGRGYGVFLIILLYLLRKSRIWQIAGVLLLRVIVFQSIPASLAAALVLFLLYNGQRGQWNMKYFFYVFYPAHILLVYGLEMLVRSF